MSASTPRKHSSGMVTPLSELGPSFGSRPQDDLKFVMMREISNQTFSFPSIELARALSPKTPKRGIEAAGKLLPLDQYDCTVDEQRFRDALDDVVAQLGTFTPQPAGSGEPASYPTLAEFLTECVKACHNALDGHGFSDRRKRWYEKLEFTVFGRTVGDRVDRASPLKPDIAGGKGISAFGQEQLYWKAPPETPAHAITLPVEVKSNWKNLVSQAATYARCLFSANPMRTFALVLAFNQDKNALRFLVFHHGGLTASEECDITKRDGLKEVARLFLTLASWSTAQEAGFITCCSRTTYLLPGDQEGMKPVPAEVGDILSWYHCVRGRMTFVARLRLPTSVPSATSRPFRTVPEPLVELGSLPPRRSARLLEMESTSADPAKGSSVQHTGRSKGGKSQGLPSVKGFFSSM